MFDDLLDKERQQLLTRIRHLQGQLARLPDGELFCVRNGSYTKWFKSNGGNPIYIPRKQKEFAQALAMKKYYSLKSDELSARLHQLEQLQVKLQKIPQKSELLLQNPCYQELISPFLSASDEIRAWMTADFDCNKNHPEHLIHKTLSGHFVRSKSEVIIANTLHLHQIPYRYECALSLGEIQLFPDFTILHPATKQLFYWEHFGMMDNPSYCENACQKLKLYCQHDIFPGINLITTYETGTHPIDSGKIEQIIQENFL